MQLECLCSYLHVFYGHIGQSFVHLVYLVPESVFAASSHHMVVSLNTTVPQTQGRPLWDPKWSLLWQISQEVQFEFE